MIKAKLAKFHGCDEVSQVVSLEGKSKQFKNPQQLKAANQKIIDTSPMSSTPLRWVPEEKLQKMRII